MNANWTLRFPRTSREAFGEWAHFENPPRGQGWARAAVLAGVFALGWLLGGA